MSKSEGKGLTLLNAARRKWYQIEQVEGPTEDCRRLLDLGLTPGADICVVQVAPFGDPLIVLVRGTRLALRRREAGWIKVQ